MTTHEAEQGYGKWTNTLLTRWRTKAKREGSPWDYAQVTERQKRGHPHSHILTTFHASDMVLGTKRGWYVDNEGNRRYEEKEAIRSAYIGNSCIECGLGDQYDVSRVQSTEAASRYVAKYLFKPTVFDTVWPKGWRRVRYSQTFPKLPERTTDAFVLMSLEDWNKLGKLASIISTNDYVVSEVVKHHLLATKVIFQPTE